jgi:hypothetical protein
VHRVFHEVWCDGPAPFEVAGRKDGRNVKKEEGKTADCKKGKQESS